MNTKTFYYQEDGDNSTGWLKTLKRRDGDGGRKDDNDDKKEAQPTQAA
jgi:hypothetical protein